MSHLAKTFTVIGILALGAVTHLSSAGDRAEREREEREESQERVEALYRTNVKALYAFMGEASQLQQQIKAGGEDSIKEKRAAWEARVKRWLRTHLAPVYASDFANARYREAASPKNGVAYEDLEAKKRMLRAFKEELRKPD